MDKYTFAEVPLIGFALDKKPLTFGYRELFSKNIPFVEVVASEPSKINELEAIIEKEKNKGILKTIAL